MDFYLNKTKTGRNDPCWCGSGRKYKKCHWDREAQSPIPLSDMHKRIKMSFNTEMCLAPESWKINCDEKISKAHTVQRSGSLTQIARKGHVYSISYDFGKSLTDESDGFVVPKLNGIKNASTFTGFCAHHDNLIFGPLEKQDFTGSSEQCFLLGYRAISKELYAKIGAEKNLELMHELDKGKPLNEQIEIQTTGHSFGTGVKVGLRDLKKLKQKYDRMLINNQYDSVRAYILKFEFPPPIMCSGAILPEHDFAGTILQDLSDLKKTMDMMTFTSFCGGKHGFVVFSWFSECDPSCMTFITSLAALPDSKVTAALIRFLFETCENIHMKPDWWEGLSQSTQTALIDRFGASILNFEDRTNPLEDDGITFNTWPLVNRSLI